MLDIYVWILKQLLYKKFYSMTDVDTLQYEFDVTKNGVRLKLSNYSEKNSVNI